MTTLDIAFHYGKPPTEPELRALADVREVYGIRRIDFDEKERTVRVEFDASRLTASVVANLLRSAGLDLQEKLTLA